MFLQPGIESKIFKGAIKIQFLKFILVYNKKNDMVV